MSGTRLDYAGASRYAHTYYGLAYDVAYGTQMALGLAGHPSWLDMQSQRSERSHNYWTLSTDAPDQIVAQLSPYGLPLPDQPDYQQRVGCEDAGCVGRETRQEGEHG